MKTYMLKSLRHDVQVIFKYNPEGWLVAFEICGNFNEKQWLWVVKENTPLNLDALMSLKAKNPQGIRIDEVPQDLSFTAFWKKYCYKVGDKKKCELLWDRLPMSDKAACMVAIDAYHRWLARHIGTDKCYPQVFIGQRRFENDFITT